MTNSVKEIMRQVHTINRDKTFIDALRLMIKEKTNSLTVVDKDGRLVGLLNTGRLIKQVIPDYLEKDSVAAHFATKEIFIEEVKKAKDVPLEKFMLSNPQKIHFNGGLMEVSLIAISTNQLRIPVVDENNKPVGIITRTELKRFFGEILDVEDDN